MTVNLMGQEEPKLTKKQKLRREIEQLKDELYFTNDQLKNEIERGSDLCKIIYKLVHGYDLQGMPLEIREIAQIAHITNNIER